jgi:hypothetical protein
MSQSGKDRKTVGRRRSTDLGELPPESVDGGETDQVKGGAVAINIVTLGGKTTKPAEPINN